MTETNKQRENKTGNILGATKIQTADGSAKATLATRRIQVNTEPRVNQSNSGGTTFVSFLTNIWGTFSINRLQYVLNNPSAMTVDPKYGVTAKVSITCETKGQADYYVKALKKGAKIDGVYGTVTFDPQYGVQIRVRAGDTGFIQRPEGDTAPSTVSEDVPFDAPTGDDDGEFMPI